MGVCMVKRFVVSEHGAHFWIFNCYFPFIERLLLPLVRFDTVRGHAGTYQGRVKVFHLIHEDEFIDKWELVREPLEGERLLYYFGYSHMGVPTNTKAMRKYNGDWCDSCEQS
jgi:hypothetical protein